MKLQVLIICLAMFAAESADPSHDPRHPGGPHQFSIIRNAPDPNLQRLGLAKYTQVFGVHLVATKNCSDAALNHAANVMAQYLDQDADGKPDRPSVTDSMVLHNAAQFIFGTEPEWDIFKAGVNSYSPDGFKAYHVTKNDHDWWNCSIVGNKTWVYAELFASEEYGGNYPRGFTPHDHQADDDQAPYGYWDGCWEEVYHIITHTGYGCAPEYKDTWNFQEDSKSNVSRITKDFLGNCGREYNCKGPYHKDNAKCDFTFPNCTGVYHYQDEGCQFPCLVNEMLYFAYSTWQGYQDFRCSWNHKPPQRPDEWEYCTQAMLKQKSPELWNMIDTDMPHDVPDGNYSFKGEMQVLSLPRF